MQAVRGLLDNGRFTPHEAVALPKRVEVTIVFREITQPIDDEKAFWADFDRKAAESANENDLLNDEAFSRRASGRTLINFADEGGAQ